MKELAESEKYIIAATIVIPDAIYKAQEFISGPNVFSVGHHRAIWTAITDLQAEEKPIDTLSVFGRIKATGNEETANLSLDIAELCMGSANLEYHCQQVVEKFIAREARNYAGGFIQESQKISADVFEIIDDLQSRLEELTGNLIQGRPVKAGDIVTDRIEASKQRVERRNEAEMTGADFCDGISSGLPSLDLITNGFAGGRLYVCAGRPGMGKSAICMNNFAYSAGLSHYPSLFKSLEMPKEELTDRILCSVAGVDYGDFQRGYLRDADFTAIGSVTTEIGKLPLFIEDQGGDSILKIRASVRKYKREFGLKMLIVDNISLIREKGFNRENEISRITGGLKRLAIEMNIPIIAISHLSRKVQERAVKIPMLSDLRDSGSIEQDADGVIFVYRPAYKDYGMEYAQKAHQEIWDSLLRFQISPEPVFEELALIDVAKNRGSMTGDCWVRWIGKHTRFEEWKDPRIREALGLDPLKPKTGPVGSYYEPQDEIENEFEGFPF